MKRITVILLMFLYLIPAVGVTVSAHYCGGKITSVKLKLIDTHKCPCGKKPMKKDCCKDVTKIFKLKNEQQKAHQFTLKVFKEFTFQPVLADNFTFCYQQPITASNFGDSSPPPDNIKHPLYIQHRVFRI